MSFFIVNVYLVERMFHMHQRIYFPSANSYATVVQLLAVCRMFQAEDMDRCVW
jgi:hypothetical protein